ncbi:hypothetical protein BJ508DRAFT_413893 [Ascobolus immersus RN42]|uniref:CENP-V/GFA domain-containing protein n=1 Tax=Ascobolus immersus RN42 TaxID=1160509 RepID=A0A3N4IM97_ASCIM|nr:hypothetical protein BJ508DRAFT_413893 [Ascobolus immersus RN42]
MSDSNSHAITNAVAFPTELTTAPTSSTDYPGSCHCGNLRYTLHTSITPANVVKCNCTLCFKYGKLAHMLHDPSSLTLLAPLPSGTNSPIVGGAEVQAALDRDELKSKVGGYAYNTKRVTHYFCKECGVHVFTIGYPFGETGGLKIGTNARAVDDLDMSGEEWKTAGYYVDGRGDFKAGFSKVPFSPGQW